MKTTTESLKKTTLPRKQHHINQKVLKKSSKWNHFPRYWPFLRGIHRSPVDYPNNGHWRRALMFSLICAWKRDWANNQDTSDLRRHCPHYDVAVMVYRWFALMYHDVVLQKAKSTKNANISRTWGKLLKAEYENLAFICKYNYNYNEHVCECCLWMISYRL